MEASELTSTNSIASLLQDSESQLFLPSEIIYQILIRLPVKSLLRFRCVSRSWLSLISSPQFIKTHLKFSSMDKEFTYHNLLLCCSDVNLSTFYTYPLYTIMFENCPHNVTELDFTGNESIGVCSIVGCCDGLFCISDASKNLVLWNPSIRKTKKLPCSENNVCYSSYVAYGFGYDECGNDYVAVEIVGRSHDRYGYQNEVSVYGLRTNSWRRILDYPGVIFCNDPGKFVNGRLHWIATHVRDMSDSWFISSLNLVDETFGTVVLPNIGNGAFDWELGTLGGHLCIFCDYNETRTDVWVMKEYGVLESWTKMVSIPRYMGIEYHVFPIFISRYDEVLLIIGPHLLLYNSRYNTFKRPQIQIEYGFGIQSSPYVESLVSPDFVEEV